MVLQAAGRQMPVRYRDTDWLTLSGFTMFGILGVSIAGAAVWKLIAGAGSITGFMVFFVPFGLAASAWSARTIVVAARPAVMLTSDAVVIPSPISVRKRAVVPVSAVAGVGLVYQRPNAKYFLVDKWGLLIWRADGHPEWGTFACAFDSPWPWSDKARTRKRYLLTAAVPGDGTRFDAGQFDPVTETDTSKLAATRAGQVASDLYKRILLQQGPGGPLATMQLQKRLAAYTRQPPWNLIAYWSPDGEIGYPASR